MIEQPRTVTAPPGDSAQVDNYDRETSVGPLKLDTDPDLLHDLQRALADAEAGRVVGHEDVMREIRALFEGRVPRAELDEFDNA
jgi:hypothetical protein